jgi:hypothetical protein
LSAQEKASGFHCAEIIKPIFILGLPLNRKAFFFNKILTGVLTGIFVTFPYH